MLGSRTTSGAGVLVEVAGVAPGLRCWTARRTKGGLPPPTGSSNPTPAREELGPRCMRRWPDYWRRSRENRSNCATGVKHEGASPRCKILSHCGLRSEEVCPARSKLLNPYLCAARSGATRFQDLGPKVPHMSEHCLVPPLVGENLR
ncbi:hypothetical protein NDU88_001122 [Pleurodeles waltl]|uniref:Uncharacterized protein n=1 Tax=Pleurodeles waltl TaxID=8319 RepID=A0AAV7M272_PLEWA|nr:hypothetical protein NDU88_001122 [Pleurodeles waltl]